MKCSSPYQKIDRMGFAKEYPCGRCLCCRVNRAEEWSTRIMMELENKDNVGDFVTLTFDDEKSCPLLSQALSKRVLQLYWKRIRKGGHKLKYFACGEYGEKHGRAHYHAVIIRKTWDETDYQKYWPWGNVQVGNVTKASARYVTGYLTKSNTIPPGKNRWPPFQLQSQGMGLEWAIRNKAEMETNLQWIPRYFQDKTKVKHQNSNLPVREFTPAGRLKQRHRNAQALNDLKA